MKKRPYGIVSRTTTALVSALFLLALAGCPKPRKTTLLHNAADINARTTTRTRHDALSPEEMRTVLFAQPMKAQATVTADIFNGLTWVPAPGAASFWRDDRTLILYTEWQQMPEATMLRFSIAGLQSASGQMLPPQQDVFQTTVRHVHAGISDTGQSRCYDGGVARLCPFPGFPGQDAETDHSPQARQFSRPTDSEDFPEERTTADPITGLTWKTCSEGLDGRECQIGTPRAFTWYQSLNACSHLNDLHAGEGFAGRHNWRLPTIAELERLIHFGHVDPALDAEAFPGTAIGRHYWPATAYGANPAYAWSVFFHDGDVTTQNRAIPGHVRCVSDPAVRAESTRPVVHSDGTVTDPRTHLRWTHCTSGLSGSQCEIGTTRTYTWEEALNYCGNLKFAGRRWRLPSVNELKSLLAREHNHPEPAIDATTFPATVPSVYWTSTTAAPITINAWYVGFGGGFGSIYRKTCHYYVRCVTEE